MDSQQCRIQEDSTCIVGSICGCNISDEGDDYDTANTISSSINVDNIESEGTGTVSSNVRACDTDGMSHQNRTDYLDLVKIPKAFIELNSRRMNYFWQSIVMSAIIVNNDIWCQIIVNMVTVIKDHNQL